jgi:hypothetical protein
MRVPLFWSAALALATVSTAIAFTPAASATPLFYDCQVIVVAGDLPDGNASTKFKAVGPATESHGGQEYSFTFGDHQIVVMANARWRAISWSHKGVVIAKGVTVLTSDSRESNVFLLYNPQTDNDEEQVSLDCAPATP